MHAEGAVWHCHPEGALWSAATPGALRGQGQQADLVVSLGHLTLATTLSQHGDIQHCGSLLRDLGGSHLGFGAVHVWCSQVPLFIMSTWDCDSKRSSFSNHCLLLDSGSGMIGPGHSSPPQTSQVHTPYTLLPT